MRIFKIWGERNVYSEEFLTDLRGLLTAKKATPATPQASAKQPEQPVTTGFTATGEFHVIIEMTDCFTVFKIYGKMLMNHFLFFSCFSNLFFSKRLKNAKSWRMTLISN